MKRLLGVCLLGALAACGPRGEKGEAESPQASAPASAAVVLYGDDAGQGFEALPGNTVTPTTAPPGQAATVIIRSSVRGNQAVGDGNSVFIRVPPEFRDQTAGRPVRVTIVSRAVPNGSPPAYHAAYSRPGRASSGWQELRPTPEFTEQTFVYTTPAEVGAEQMDDLILIYADAEGQGRGIEIKSVKVEPSK